MNTKVALVLGEAWATPGPSRAIALLLAAHGTAVVVVGPEERPLGEVVGEMVYGGGRARHVVGDPRKAGDLRAAIDKAQDVFGGVDAVIACTDAPVEVMRALVDAMPDAGGNASTPTSPGHAGQRQTDALFLSPRNTEHAEPEKLAEHVVALLTSGSATTTFKMF